jgi:hypothetical protein
MAHKQHRNIFIKVSPQIEHLFDADISNNNHHHQIIWISRALNNLWSLLFNRWNNYRTPDLDRLVVILYYGGFIEYNPHSMCGVFSSDTNLLKSKFLGATTFDYLQYITNQTERISNEKHFIR